MNITNLQVLTRKTPLEDHDWEQMIRNRIDAIKPNLDRTSLSRIGDITIAGKGNKQGEDQAHCISSDNPKIIGEGFSLNTHGFFHYSSNWISQNAMIVYGLTRKGDLVLMEIALQSTCKKTPFTEIEKEYRALSISIKKATPKEVLDASARIEMPPFKYQNILDVITGWIKEWHRRAQIQADRANDLVTEFEIEDRLIKLAQNKNN